MPPRVSFGRASRDRAMLAFESPVAAACARHNDARTFFQKARSKRKKPATAAAVADFGTRRLPGDVGHEDGSPPAHDDAPGADAPPTVSAAPAAKRRRSEPDMICQGLHVPGLAEEQKAQLTSRLLAVLDRGIGRWEEEVTSAGDDEMA